MESNYFSSFFKGLGSLLKGMSVTGKYFFSRKITQQYPENRKTLEIPERFRATLSLIYDEEGNHKCIACGICQNNCPNGTITIISKKIETEDGKTKRVLDRYLYDLGSCSFCQMCVSTCPNKAIEFKNDFEQAVFSRQALVKQLNRPEPTAQATKEEKSE